jgi:N-acetylglucosamine kinase-like BadF-type ATPase
MNFRNKYVLAIDQGTTSSRAILFNHQGTIITLAQKPFQQYFPKPGWVEHDPNEIWYTQSSVIKEAMAKADVTDSHIACIGIANQRETGTGRLAFPYTMRSYGRIAVRRIIARNLNPKAGRNVSCRRPGW